MICDLGFNSLNEGKLNIHVKLCLDMVLWQRRQADGQTDG